MNFILDKWQEFKAMPTKNKLALGLMFVLILAVIVKYYPSSGSDSSIEITKKVEPKSALQNDKKTREGLKLTKEQIETVQKIVNVLQKYPQGIYLKPKLSSTDWQSMANDAQISLNDLQDEKSHWRLQGSSENLEKIEYFINAALRAGFESEKSDLKFIDSNWTFDLSFKSINN